MKSYCVRQKKQTGCIPGSERITTTGNGRKMMKCACSECGAIKTRFIAGQRGGAVGKNDFACGYDLKGKRPGTATECFNKGQIRYWGLNELPYYETIDVLLHDRQFARNKKARERRAVKKPAVKKPVVKKLNQQLVLYKPIENPSGKPIVLHRPIEKPSEKPEMSEEDVKENARINKMKLNMLKDVLKEAGKYH